MKETQCYGAGKSYTKKQWLGQPASLKVTTPIAGLTWKKSWSSSRKVAKKRFQMLWGGSHKKVRCTECVISRRKCGSHYLPSDKGSSSLTWHADKWREFFFPVRCKFPEQVPHEYLVSKIQASDLENKVSSQSE